MTFKVEAFSPELGREVYHRLNVAQSDEAFDYLVSKGYAIDQITINRD